MHLSASRRRRIIRRSFQSSPKPWQRSRPQRCRADRGRCGGLASLAPTVRSALGPAASVRMPVEVMGRGARCGDRASLGARWQRSGVALSPANFAPISCTTVPFLADLESCRAGLSVAGAKSTPPTHPAISTLAASPPSASPFSTHVGESCPRRVFCFVVLVHGIRRRSHPAAEPRSICHVRTERGFPAGLQRGSRARGHAVGIEFSRTRSDHESPRSSWLACHHFESVWLDHGR